MKKTIALIAQILMIFLIVFCIYYIISSGLWQKAGIIINAYFKPPIPENILSWSETVSGAIYLIISITIIVITVRKGIFKDDDESLYVFIFNIPVVAFVVAIYCYATADFTGSNDAGYQYKHLMLVVFFVVGLIASILTSCDTSESEENEKLSYNKILACSIAPLLHSYLILPFGFTPALVTAVFFTIFYYLFCQTILVIHWSFKRLSSYQ